MTTINLKKYSAKMSLPTLAGLLATLLIWLLIAHFQTKDTTIGTIDPSILQVIILAICTWLALLFIALLLLGSLFSTIILNVQHLFEPLKKLTSWQHHILYLALFALLVLSGTGCLIAIC